MEEGSFCDYCNERILCSFCDETYFCEICSRIMSSDDLNDIHDCKFKQGDIKIMTPKTTKADVASLDYVCVKCTVINHPEETHFCESCLPCSVVICPQYIREVEKTALLHANADNIKCCHCDQYLCADHLYDKQHLSDGDINSMAKMLIPYDQHAMEERLNERKLVKEAFLRALKYKEARLTKHTSKK